MKKIIKIFLVLLVCLSIKTVYAENYKLKELIPYNVDTTIHTDNFSYIGIRFDEKGIHFNGIRNITDEKKPISISIGLFDRRGINIGTVNYCDFELDGNTEMSYIIKYDGYLSKKNKISDIKYIAVLGDNINCRTKGSEDYLGKSISKMGVTYDGKLDDQTGLFISILAIVGGALFVFLLYKLIFTKSFRNVDGKEVRKAYEDINKELKQKRMKEMMNEVEVLDEKSSKPEEIIKQEEEAKNEDKEGTDLHNLYK